MALFIEYEYRDLALNTTLECRNSPTSGYVMQETVCLPRESLRHDPFFPKAHLCLGLGHEPGASK